MSYEQHFGLSQQPYSNAADSRFYFESPQHYEAMVRIEHCVSTMKGLAVVIGEAGAGKTLLARKALEKLEEDGGYDAALLVIVHTEVTADWLLHKIALQLGIENPPTTKAELLPQLLEKLLEINEAGRKAVVLIDEANMFRTKEIFEEFRGLTNLEVPGQKLISLVLFGLPEIEDYMALDPPLAQRVALKFTIRPLDREATGKYIRHRLLIAGATHEIFSDSAIDEIQRFSSGTPRLINTICDNCLLESYLMKKGKIDVEQVTSVCGDLGLKIN